MTKNKSKSSDIFKYSMNRELSWLNFNRRVLYESMDELTPLFEGLKFIAIFDSNLEEFYRVRVGSLTDLSYVEKAKPDNKTGMTPKEQLYAIYDKTKVLLSEKDDVYSEVAKELEERGIKDISFNELTKKERKNITKYYDNYIAPVLAPQTIDELHPFPFIENNKLHLLLEMTSNSKKVYGLLQVPDLLDRIVFLDREDEIAFIRIENIIENLIGNTFVNYNIEKIIVFNIHRNADINIEEYMADNDEDYKNKDYLDFMKIILKKRNRLQAVSLTSNKPISKSLREFLSNNLFISENQFFISKSPLIMGYVFSLEDKVRENKMYDLLYEPFSPKHNIMLDENRSYISQALEKDILFIYPYEDINDFIKLLDEASEDPRVLSIKITIYRLAKNSRVIRALIRACENNKKVTVLMELQARFDEESNINYSDTLIDAGCNLIYGVSGYKVHSKVCLITLKENEELKYITQIGTGNYNEKTSTQYTDLSLITSNTEIALDTIRFFHNISISNIDGEYNKLLVSPNGFKSKIIKLIDEEIKKGEDGRIFFKFNSFTDKDIITKLSEASISGVKIKLIIRGISCLRPEIKGYTENIQIKSIVGRYLEHPRIYIFGEGENSKVYIGSADLMTRNTEKRLEVTTPVLDNQSKEKIIKYMDYQWMDNTKARKMNLFGEYEELPKDNETFISQDFMIQKVSSDLENYKKHQREKEIQEEKLPLKKSILEKVYDFFSSFIKN